MKYLTMKRDVRGKEYNCKTLLNMLQGDFCLDYFLPVVGTLFAVHPGATAPSGPFYMSFTTASSLKPRH